MPQATGSSILPTIAIVVVAALKSRTIRPEFVKITSG
jgi:hypothetical protein